MFLPWGYRIGLSSISGGGASLGELALFLLGGFLGLDLVTVLPKTRPPFRSVSEKAKAIATSNEGNTVSEPVVRRLRLRIGSSMTI